MRIETNRALRRPFVCHACKTTVFFYLKFWFKAKFIIIYGEMRIETHHMFKVSVFATHVKITYFLLKILFPKYCIKVFLLII